MAMVSVVIPTKDRSQELERAIGSVKSQNWPSVEILVVENNSIAPGLIEKLCLKLDVRYLTISGDCNANTARNLGWMHSKGEFVAFLDSDDEWLPDHLDSSIKVMENEKSDFLYSSAYVFDGEKTKIKSARSLEKNERPIDYLLGWRRGYAQTSSFILRKKIRSIVKWDETLKRNQDLQFFIDVISQVPTSCKISPDYIIHWLKGEERDFDLDSHLLFISKNIGEARKRTIIRSFLIISRLFVKKGDFKSLFKALYEYIRLFRVNR